MTSKEKLWEAIENYRCSGGRDEHQANKYLLGILIDELVYDEDEVLAETARYRAEVERLKGLLRMAMHTLMDLDNGLVVHEGGWHTRHHVAISKIKECLK